MMMDDDDECGAVGGMAGRANQSTWCKPVPVPLCLPKTYTTGLGLEPRLPWWEL
jgi:hypothetical protein